jgi:hypothetical protein
VTNESFSPPSELPATLHGIANCDPLLVQQTTRGAISTRGIVRRFYSKVKNGFVSRIRDELIPGT